MSPGTRPASATGHGGNPDLLVYAHRGDSAHAPENTLTSFRMAQAAGAHGVELDVHLCSTGEVVVIHDYNLKRTTGLDARVEETPWSAIRELDAGGWMDARFRGERIPLLTEVLDALGPETQVDVEIKWSPGRIGPLEDLVVREIGRRGRETRTLVSSFHPMSVRAVARKAPGLRTAVIYTGTPPMPFWLRRGQARFFSGSRVLKPHHTLVSERTITRWRNRGLDVLPWTVDDPIEARRLAGLGVQGIITNDPAAVTAALQGTRP